MIAKSVRAWSTWCNRPFFGCCHKRKCDYVITVDAEGQIRCCVMTTLIFPARSLRSRPASLRLFPEGTRYSICKGLIWHVLLVVWRTISGIQSIFVPALREKPKPSDPNVSASSGSRGPNAIRPRGPAIDRGASPGCSLGPPVRRPAPSLATPAPASLGSVPPATIALPDPRTLQR
jgi:hypothetical protein